MPCPSEGVAWFLRFCYLLGGVAPRRRAPVLTIEMALLGGTTPGAVPPALRGHQPRRDGRRAGPGRVGSSSSAAVKKHDRAAHGSISGEAERRSIRSQQNARRGPP